MEQSGKKFFLNILPLLIISVVLTGGVKQAQSQERYPTRPIEIISPYGPGGGNDMTARITADYLKKKWGVPVNVVNKPGGNTIPANVELYRAAPDGYTVLCDQEAASVGLEVVVPNLPFKVFDRTWIAIPHLIPMWFILPSNSPYKNLDDLVAEIKKDPENFTWASWGGSGGADTFTRKLFKAVGVDVHKTRPVICAGAAQSVALTAGGHVKIAGVSVASSLPAIDAGTVKPLAIVMKERHPDFPGVPSTPELGYPTVIYLSWIGFSGPPKMSSHIVDMWNKELKEMSKDPEVISRFKAIKSFLVYIGAPEMKELVIKTEKELSELYAPKK